VAGDRISHLADILTGYSTGVEAGSTVLVESFGPRALPLVRAVHRRCLQRGARLVECQHHDPSLVRDFHLLASVEQLEHFPRHRLDFLMTVDVTIGIRAEENAMELATVPRERIVARARVLRPLLERRINHTRWVVTRVPTEAMAQEAGVSLEEMEDLFFAACLQDWSLQSARQERLAEALRAGSEVRILGPDTDLTLSIRGMPVSKADGHHNLPDGEVFTVPVLTSAQGTIRFNAPSYYGGTRLEGITLRFQRGVVVEAGADRGAEDLRMLLATDQGASRLGEFAFGLNQGIRKPVGNILFDEKIAGSIHLALGNAYGACSNGNVSAIHWDLVRLMEDGEVHLDGQLLQRHGRFVRPGLECLNPPEEERA
jgi:aminopeptidase